jgi:hypothetical protein
LPSHEGRRTGKLYDVRDRLTEADLAKLGLTIQTALGYRNFVKAIQTGEFRPPRQGEWYLSGAIVEAYRAPNDLTTDYFLARLVKVKTVTVTLIDDS